MKAQFMKYDPVIAHLRSYMSNKFQLSGSRYMATKGFDGVTLITDWDFVTFEGDPNIDQLLETFSHLHFSSTTAEPKPATNSIILTASIASTPTEPYLDGSTVAIHKFGIGGEFQLIVKKKELFEAYVKVFNKLKVSDYKKYIWKGSGITREQIRNNIELLINYEI